jgi:hypothetical protein
MMVNSDFVNPIEKLLDLRWCIPAQERPKGVIIARICAGRPNTSGGILEGTMKSPLVDPSRLGTLTTSL